MSRPEIAQPQPCPDPETWVRFAAGICAPGQQDSLLDHAAGCGPCADRLRDLLNAVSSDESPLDSVNAASIDTLSAGLEQKRRKLSRAMSGTKVSSPSRKYWMLAVAAGLTILAALSGWLVSRRLQSKPPLHLLATAYTSRRTMELQIPGAGYSPLQVSRASNSLIDLPQALLESQLQIKRHLETKPEDPDWLHAQGRAQLLLWEFDAAIRSFQAAADLGANSPDFLIDYASAYYQRAERNSVALDYALALEKLGQALKQRPEDPAALFNRGIVHTKLHQYDSAIDDFEYCLRVQTDPKWKEETQTRLGDVKRLRTGLFHSYPSPSAEFRAEHDLETVMASELVGFFHSSSSKPGQTAVAMLEQHQDPWLSEVIRLRNTPETVRAVESLSRLTNFRIVVNPDYESLAAEIQWLAAASLPLPLRVWRDYEILYRNTRSAAVATCAADTEPLIAAGSRYPWMEAQILLESSLCSAATQDFVKAGVLVDRAEALINEKKLLLTSIRIPNFRGQRLAETGYFREAVQVASDALSRFDAGSYPLRRAYDFHGIIMLVASQLNLPNTGYGASRMMASVGDNNGIHLFKMVGLCRQAGFALSLGLDADAAAALRSAEAVLSKLGDNPTAKIYWRTSRIAWLESRQDVQSLYRMLDEARREGPAKKENLYFNRKLISALCRLESRSGRRSRVEQMADQFWNDAAGKNNALQPGALRAFRPELESVSQSLTTVRLDEGNETGALESWLRFLTFDHQLLGGRENTSEPGLQATPVAILTVAGLGEKVAVWFQSGGQTRFHWASESYPDLAQRVRKLRRLCSLGASTTEISSDARALYGILFPEGIGRASYVFIRTRGLFNMLPLTTFLLLNEGRSATFSFLPFGEPSAVMTNSANATRMTVVAATKFDSRLGLPALPEADIEEEITAASQAFADATVIRGAEVTAKAIEEAAMNSQALHFIGHAGPWRGTISLLVSPDDADQSLDGRAGFWSMGRPRSVNAGLVVLSACSTGAFEDLATAEPGQLALSMLLAGANQVVASLWDVDSSATAAWNRAFYGYIAGGEAPANALKLASEQLRTTPKWQCPKYWAGFALYQQ